MRTVREILKESDLQEIADILLQLHLRTLFEQAKPEDTVADIKNLIRQWTGQVISRTVNAAPQKGRSPFVFFAVPAAADASWWFGCGAIEAAMCEQSEILQSDTVPASYSWMDQTYANIADSLVAETPLTKENLNEVLADILWELTWFGDTDEERRDFMDGLDSDNGEEENDDNDDEHLIWEKEFERFRAEQEARRDDKEEKLKQIADQAERARYEYCFQREVRLVKALLEEHMAQKSDAEDQRRLRSNNCFTFP